MPNATELSPLADVKSYLQITTSAKDAILQSIKDAVEQYVKDYCGRDFLVASYVDYYDGDGSDTLLVRQRPILTVDSIYIDPARLFQANTLVPSQYIIQDPRAWTVGYVQLYAYRFLTGVKSTQINYTAGYATIPADVQLAVKLICAKLFVVQDKVLFAQPMQRVGDMQITLSPDAWPKDAITILDRYRRMQL